MLSISKTNPKDPYTMKKYYYVNKKGQQAGPVTADQLIQHGVTAKTYVWCTGMDNWDKAGNIEELKHLFVTDNNKGKNEYGTLFDSPTQEDENMADCPNNNLLWAIVSAISFWPLAIVAIIKAIQVKKLWKEGEQELATQSANQARTWAIASIISGAVFATMSNATMLIICIAIALLK